MATLGAEIVFIAPGEVHVAFPFAEEFCQQNGFMHAGAIASVADSANGYAAYTLAPPDTDVLAVEFKINLLAPARGAGFLACGRVLRRGRTLTVCQADVFTTGAPNGPSSPPCSQPSSCVRGVAVTRLVKQSTLHLRKYQKMPT
jgi:uncharacterized protein (TIGR00369 family)